MNAEHAGDRRELSTSEGRRSAQGLLGLLVASMCCGLPFLLGAGIAVGVAGLALGSGVVVIVATALAVWGWRRRGSECPDGESGTVRANRH
jgi:hypothetical protein